MEDKKDPTHKIRIQALRKMPPEERLRVAFELSDLTDRLFIQGLKRKFPNLSGEEFKKVLWERLDKCHNRNY